MIFSRFRPPCRCGLAVPDAPEVEGIAMDDGVKRGYTALRQPWRPDTSGVASKYAKKVEKRIGPDLAKHKETVKKDKK